MVSRNRTVVTLLVVLLFAGSTFAAGAPTEIDVPFTKSTEDVDGNVTYSFNHSGEGQVILHGTGERRGSKVTRNGIGTKTISISYPQRESSVTLYGKTTPLTATEDFKDPAVSNFTVQSTSSSDTIVRDQNAFDGYLTGYVINETVRDNSGTLFPDKSETVDLTIHGAGEKLGSEVTRSGSGNETFSFDHWQRTGNVTFQGATVNKSTEYTEDFSSVPSYESQNVTTENGELVTDTFPVTIGQDRFDDGDIAEYSGDTGAFTENSGVLEGASVTYDSVGPEHLIINDSDTMSPGQSASFDLNHPGGGPTANLESGFIFAYQNSSSWYALTGDLSGATKNGISLEYWDGSQLNQLDSTGSPLNGITEFTVEWSENDVITVYREGSQVMLADVPSQGYSISEGNVGYFTGWDGRSDPRSPETHSYGYVSDGYEISEQQQYSSGYAIAEYSPTDSKEIKLNWTDSGDVTYSISVGDTSSFTEVTSEDVWIDTPDGTPVYVKTTLNSQSATVDSLNTSARWKSYVSDPSITINGTEVATYNGTLKQGESVTRPIPDLSNGSHSFNVSSTTAVPVEWEYTGNNDGRTYVSAVTVGGATVTPDQLLGSGETYSTSVSLSEGYTTVDVNVSNVGETQTVSKTTFVEPNPDGVGNWERTYSSSKEIHELNVSIDGDDDITKNVTKSGSNFTVNFSIPIGSGLTAFDIETKTHVDDPSVDVDADGAPEVQHNGTLREGESVTQSISNLHPGNYTFTTFSGSSVPVNWRYEGYSEGRVFVESIRIGNSTATVNQYLSKSETYTAGVNVTPGEKTFGVETGENSLNANVSELEVTGAYPAYRGVYVNQDDPLTHKIAGHKNVVWNYSHLVSEGRPITNNVTMWTDGNYANVTFLSLDPRSEDTVAQFTAEMDQGTFHLEIHNVEPNAEYIVYRGGVAATTITADDSGTLSWEKSDGWSTYSFRFEKLASSDGEDTETPTNQTEDGMIPIPGDGCEGAKVPGIGCVPKPVSFWGKRIGAAVGTGLAGVRAWQEYSGNGG